MSLPNDPVILLSYVNTMLRDKYSDLDELCYDIDADKQALTDKLMQLGYEYSKAHNSFKAIKQ